LEHSPRAEHGVPPHTETDAARAVLNEVKALRAAMSA
jgi:hypothetical protein